MPGPTISIVIPVRDEPRAADAVEAVLAQDGAEDLVEVLVVGSGLPALPSDPRVTRIEAPPAGPGANRNRGIAHARGEALIFLDADCAPRPGWLRALRE